MIAVVGGGISGLAAAYELSTRNVPFKLFEASDRLGGLVRTEHVDGFTIEAGADSMLAQKRAALDLCRELGLDARLISTKTPRTAFVLHRGRLHPLPSPSLLGIPATWSGLLGFDLLPVSARLRVGMEPLVRRGGADAESIGAFFARRFGRRTVDLIAQPLLGGIHAGDVNALSLRGLMPRLAEAEASGSVLRWVQRTATGGPGGSAFRSLAGGMGELVDAIRKRLPEDAISLRAPVASIERGWTLKVNGAEVTCSAVIVAAPAHAAARMLATLDPEIAGLCAATRYTSTASVVLAWPRSAVRHPLGGTGFVVARAGDAPRMNACTWVTSKFEGRAPDGMVLLRVFFGGALDPAAADLADDELIGIAVRELSPVLGLSGAATLARVYRWRNAGAQHDVGQPQRQVEIRHRLPRGLFVAGSGFTSVGIPDCVADGRAAAAAAASTL